MEAKITYFYLRKQRCEGDAVIKGRKGLWRTIIRVVTETAHCITWHRYVLTLTALGVIGYVWYRSKLESRCIVCIVRVRLIAFFYFNWWWVAQCWFCHTQLFMPIIYIIRFLRLSAKNCKIRRLLQFKRDLQTRRTPRSRN